MNISSNVAVLSLQFTFVGVLLIFLISWCAKKIFLVLQRNKTFMTNEIAVECHQKEQDFRLKHNAWKQSIQKENDEKSARFKNEVLLPREQARRERLDREFYKHFGPLWSGEGNALGGGECEHEGGDLTENERAARRRRIPEPDSVTRDKIMKQSKIQKPKRVIELPPEPSESDPRSVMVVLRTPISTIVQRRFLLEHTFQDVLDFMTKSGFNQRCYQLCTAFPRVVLSNSHATLSQLAFNKRTTLNIEEISDD